YVAAMAATNGTAAGSFGGNEGEQGGFVRPFRSTDIRGTRLPQWLGDPSRQAIVHRLPQRGFEQAGIARGCEKRLGAAAREMQNAVDLAAQRGGGCGRQRLRSHDPIDLDQID